MLFVKKNLHIIKNLFIYFRCDAHLMKECKEPCVKNNQGPDIIPQKSFFHGKKMKGIYILTKIMQDSDFKFLLYKYCININITLK